MNDRNARFNRISLFIASRFFVFCRSGGERALKKIIQLNETCLKRLFFRKKSLALRFVFLLKN